MLGSRATSIAFFVIGLDVSFPSTDGCAHSQLRDCAGASDWEWTGGGGMQELDWEEIKADLGEVVGAQTQSNGDDLCHTLL